MWCNCQRICSWSKMLETVLEIRKKTIFFELINKSIFNKFFKDFTNSSKKTKRQIVWWALLNIWKTRFFQTLIEEFESSGSQFFWPVSVGYELINQLGSYRNVCSLRLVLEGKADSFFNWGSLHARLTSTVRYGVKMKRKIRKNVSCLERM